MSTHIESHCNQPSLLFKQVGSMWRCDCGNQWVVSKFQTWSGSHRKQWIGFKDQENTYDFTAICRDLRWLRQSVDAAEKQLYSLGIRVNDLEYIIDTNDKKVKRGKPTSK